MQKTNFVCAECGYNSAEWLGKCPNCGGWNSFKEFKQSKSVSRVSSPAEPPAKMSEIKDDYRRKLSTGFKSVDEVSGGGILAGAVFLFSGSPGIGKSTLVLQLVANLGEKVLYVSAEESLGQIKARALRLKVSSGADKNLYFQNQSDLDQIMTAAGEGDFRVLVVDSIQTIAAGDIEGSAGSVSQVRDCALRLQEFAKKSSIAIIIIGHVTKEGIVAGPKLLEHIVDGVFFLEAETIGDLRILRSQKNRFGSTDEIAVLQMSPAGFREIDNPSEIFLSERVKDVAGSTVTAVYDSGKIFLLEIQALTSTTIFGYPQRRAVGIDYNRLQQIVTVLSRRTKINLQNQDVLVSVSGGYRVREAAADVAVALAIASSYLDKPLDPKLCAFGEVGLLGEIKKVPFAEKRLKEAKKLGFAKFISARILSAQIKELFG